MNHLSQGTQTRSSRSFAEQAGRVASARGIFERYEVPVDPRSELAQIMTAAEALACRDPSRPIQNQAEFDQMPLSAHFDRLSDAILMLNDHPAPAPHLRRLTAHSLDFINSRAPSPAKDAFWELELWEKIRRRHASAELAEPISWSLLTLAIYPLHVRKSTRLERRKLDFAGACTSLIASAASALSL